MKSTLDAKRYRPSRRKVPTNPAIVAKAMTTTWMVVATPMLPVSMYQMVPAPGETMSVRKAKAMRIPYTASWRFWTILSGGRNFIFGTKGPPRRLSTKEGI